jgi:glycine/D-amino acid oxidase-like deaminating enzyme
MATASDRDRRGSSATRGPRVVVVGAGAFGGWTALALLRKGARVTLLDSRGAGNRLASSAGETRVTRAVYGDNAAATLMAISAMRLWKEHQERSQVELFRERGVLWLASDDDSYLAAALPLLAREGRAFEEMTPAQAARRYPVVDFDGVRRVVLEPAAGYLLARRACETVARAVVSEGGDLRQVEARPPDLPAGRPVKGAALERRRLESLLLASGERLMADAFVFACGPWLGSLFPGLIGDWVRPTRQELFTFATPAGDARFRDDHLPTWVDLGPPLRYGIPGDEGRGLKCGDDTRGALFDPTSGDRTTSARGESAVRAYLERRLPALRDAPLESAQVCQYEETPDRRFLLDRHPHATNVFIAGGGSGHGFKHSPVVGEMVADMVLEGTPPDPAFALDRLLT